MNDVPTRRSGLTLDQQLALRTAAGRLQERFDGVFSTETLERFLHHSYDEFADRAAVAQWLPLMAERFATQRLTALARIEGRSSDTRPVVLFLCVHNAGRSQMALGFFENLAGDRVIGWSGGSQPASTINPAARAAGTVAANSAPPAPLRWRSGLTKLPMSPQPSGSAGLWPTH